MAVFPEGAWLIIQEIIGQSSCSNSHNGESTFRIGRDVL